MGPVFSSGTGEADEENAGMLERIGLVRLRGAKSY